MSIRKSSEILKEDMAAIGRIVMWVIPFQQTCSPDSTCPKSNHNLASQQEAQAP